MHVTGELDCSLVESHLRVAGPQLYSPGFDDANQIPIGERESCCRDFESHGDSLPGLEGDARESQ